MGNNCTTEKACCSNDANTEEVLVHHIAQRTIVNFEHLQG